MTTPAPASEAAAAHHASYGTQEAPYGAFTTGDFTTFGGYDANGFATGGHAATHPAATSFEADPLFGSLEGSAHDTGAHDATQWTTGTHQPPGYDPYAAQHTAYDTGAYDSTAWTGEYQQLSVIPQQAGAPDVSGQWDASAWAQPEQTAADPTQQWEWGTQAFDTGAYDATQWNSDGSAANPATAVPGEDFSHHAETHHADTHHAETHHAETHHTEGELHATGEMPAADEADRADPAQDLLLLDDQEEVTPAPATRAGSRAASRSRRRTPPKRSALLTVAVPSACVMSVAGIAAASVGSFGDDSKDTSTTAADAPPVKPSTANSRLDTQLESLSAEADDFADRASRTQERIDLKAQQEAEQRKAAAEAARKERLRPKYALPVAQHGLSAYFGQAGINWMSVHTGIDFPVAYGSTVMAATDGTVRTEYNSAYGNMMIVTAMDGTETWYCHLSSYRVAPGTTVKAGDPIAYSGNSGNSTGPHLHFEVRPGGGSAVDPLAWLRSHGLEPS
jgi:murein DD-endopeptidase MepM/ murein hydrolase activator NlpD